MTQTVILSGPKSRADAANLCRVAPGGTVASFKAPSRSSEQNARMWAMLSEISRAKPEGRELPPEVWKSLFMSEAGFKPIFEPALDGRGVVPIGYKSSRLTKAEFGDLFLAIEAYAAEHGIELGDNSSTGTGECRTSLPGDIR
jgi:hypothetical protein